jgi:hypothetical protein
MVKLAIVQPDGSTETIEQNADPTLAQYYSWLDCSIIEYVPIEALPGWELITDEEALVRSDKTPIQNQAVFGLTGLVIFGAAALQPAGTLK